jgi:chromate transport protein ChrA
VATAATCLPSCTLSYFAVRVWQRFRGARWRRAVEAGLAPITIGLVLATGWLVARGAQASWMAYAVTAPSAALVLFTRVNALWLLAGAAALGLLGLGRRTRSARPACRCSASIPIGSGSRCRRLWPCSSWPDSPGARGRCVAGTDRVVGARRLCSSPGLLA